MANQKKRSTGKTAIQRSYKTKKKSNNILQRLKSNFSRSSRKSQAIKVLFVLAFATVGVYMVFHAFAADTSDSTWFNYAQRVRYCESGHNYGNNDTGGNGHYGAYQFSPSTWYGVASNHGYNEAVSYSNHIYDASPYMQDRVAYYLFKDYGFNSTASWAASWGCATSSAPDGNLGPALSYPDGAPSVGASSGSINNPGTDCHTYTIQYDPSHYYPCVAHLQNDLGINADGYFGPGTKSSVQSVQASHGLNQTGIVDPATWCVIHTDLPGCGTPAAAPAPAANQDPKGVVDAQNCQHIVGWSFDPDNSSSSIQVHVYIDGVGYNTGNTSAARPDVNAAYGISGTHGFDYATPARWHDGQTHDVVVFGINTPSGNNPIIGGGKLGPCSPPATPTPPTGTTTTTTPANNGGAITGAASNRCLDVPGQNFSNGMYTQLWDCNGSAAQKWTFLSNGAIQAANNKCLDVSGGSTANGAQVIIWDCHYGSNQQWTRNPDGTIRSRQTGKCLDAIDYGTSNGTRIQMYDCVGGSNQKWR